MSVPAKKRARGEQARSTADAATHDKSADASEEKGAAAPQNDRVLVLNVGGTNITTLQSTLCSSPSLLAEWAKNDFPQFPRDLQGHPFLDRDPNIFAHIVNYLRGYGLPSRADDLVVIAEDAELFELEALKREIGLNPPSMWRFTPGPGVREDGVEFSTSDILDLCGTEPLSTGLVHTIVFRMDKCELVSVGVVAFKEIQLDMQIRRQKNSVCYCNTGEFVRYWSSDALYDQGVLYKSQDEITVRVEFAQPGVPLEPSGEASLVERSLPPPLQLAVRLAEPLPSSVATANASSVGGAGPAITRLPTPASAAPAMVATTRTTVTINTGITSEPNTTASALQPGSPVMDATANRGLLGSRTTAAPLTTSVATATPATLPIGATLATASAVSGGITANPNAAPAVAAPLSSPSTLPTAAPANGGQAATAPPSPSLPVAPIVLDPEDPDAAVGAIVTFYKGDKEVCRARWPAPVPPLQFAVSMQGASAVSILRASSVSPDAVNVEAEK
ncbi:BTB/POZ domain containing protein [Lotmaria passim]